MDSNEIAPLNITGKELCARLGLADNKGIPKALRDLGLVRFFQIGKKTYMYPIEDVDKVNEKLLNGEISIKVNGGYYITLNEK